MAIVRVGDVFNAAIGSTGLIATDTQVLGVTAFEIQHGFRSQSANSDGTPGRAAFDRTAFFASARLTCEDPAQFNTIIALFETYDTQYVMAAGKKAGALIAVSYIKAMMNRAKLVGASLNLRQGGYAQTAYDFRNSAAGASNTSDDEVKVEAIGAGSLTLANKLRGVRLLDASFDPVGVAGAIAPLGIMGLDLNVRWEVNEFFGDADWGATVETFGFQVSGSLTIQDFELSGTQTIAQALCDAEYGTLTMNYQQQTKTTALNKGTIVVPLLAFDSSRMALNARRPGEVTIPFQCFHVDGTTQYNFSGVNKAVAVTTA